MPKVKTAKVRGIEVPINVNEYGMFQATIMDQDLEHETLDGLMDKLIKASSTEKKPMSIRFQRLSYGGQEAKPVIHHGTITGVHLTNHNLLVKFEGKKGVEQESGWKYTHGNRADYLRMNESQEEELLALAVESQKLNRALTAMLEKYAFHPKEDVMNALGVKSMEEVD